MKIDIDGLKASFRDSVREKAPSSFKDCPSPQKIVRLMRSGSSDKEATEIIDHITRCRSCFSEFEFVRDVVRQEKEILPEFGRLFLSMAKGPAQRKEPGWRAFMPRLRWAAALFLVGVIIMAAITLKPGLFRPSEKYRSLPRAGVELTEPAGEKVIRSRLAFKWERVQNSRHYIVELFDQALAPVWRSDAITEESAAPPREVADSLEAGRPYFWMATAVLADGERVSSPLEKIVLIE